MDQLDVSTLAGIYRFGEARRPTQLVTYRVETLDQVREDILRLIDFHYDEIAQFKTVQKLDPDWDTYAAMEKSGRLWVLTARDRGTLVGYIVMIVARALHYKSLLMASEDIHYILPEYRKGLTGYRLLAKAKQAMTEKGCKLMLMRCKADKSHAALFERLDGELSDLVYAFRL